MLYTNACPVAKHVQIIFLCVDYISTLYACVFSHSQEWKRERNLIWPCLVDHVTEDMRLAWEEPFGPLLPIKRIETPDQGVEHCNKSRLGLQGCVFTQVWRMYWWWMYCACWICCRLRM